MGDVVPVRVAAERLGIDRRHLSRLLHHGDLPTAAWREQGRWVDVDALQAALAARRNGGGRDRVHHGDGNGIDPAFRAAATAIATDVVTAALADLRAVAQRLADLEDERAALVAERERLTAEARRRSEARRAYEQRRAELSAALANVGRGNAGR